MSAHVARKIHVGMLLQVAAYKDRLAQAVRQQMQTPVGNWGVREVCDWVEHIGLGQYRKRFLHHCIGGDLLLQLTDTHLKARASPRFTISALSS